RPAGRRSARGARARPARRPSREFGWRSYLDHYGQDHRTAAGAVVDELPDAVVEVLLQELDLDDVVREAAVEDLLRLDAHLVHQRPLGVGEPAGDQLRRGAA